MTDTGPTRVDDQYAALYREHNARLVAYARSLTGSAAVAEDLAAEAHFRVWRRIRAGHVVDNPSAYLTTTVRNLAAGLGRAQREIARDVAELPEDPQRAETLAEGPERRASQVDLISRLLKELPERWAKALWYAEVEDLPMAAVGEHIGASAGTTAVVLTRARERLRQAFLQSQPGRPASGECERYWKQMPTIVRATASARRTRSVLDHCDGCEDCRARMLALTEANTRLPLLLGPALLGIVLGGGAWFLPAVAGVGAAAGTAGGAKAAGAVGAKAAGTAAGTKTAGAAAGTKSAGATTGTAARAGTRAGGGARHARLGAQAGLAKHGVSPAKATVFGATAAAVGVAAMAAAMALGATNPPSHPNTAAAQPTAAAATTAKSSTAAAATTATSPAAEHAVTASTPASTTAAPTTAPSTPPASAAATAAGSRPESQAAATAPATSTSPASVPPPTTPAPVAPSTTPAAPTSLTAAPTIVAASPSATASTLSTLSTPSAPASPTAAPSPSLTPTPSQTSGSPSPSPTSAPSAPPSCVVYFYGLCVIW
jgi:RNA polymerase sigma factor (sigma-70 family)